ncbi:hypothetical protein T4B_7240 [Trichinella pseudospiralis]|uniref:Uncharacterized protein n=1 Tax=Trichinella pseudospiralis TaxID=6337 RepID=A0A0V1IMQ9_TRIPS|nr:hypothetical protein T4B_7240 [Trichinella pseudospiralis]
MVNDSRKKGKSELSRKNDESSSTWYSDHRSDRPRRPDNAMNAGVRSTRILNDQVCWKCNTKRKGGMHFLCECITKNEKKETKDNFGHVPSRVFKNNIRPLSSSTVQDADNVSSKERKKTTECAWCEGGKKQAKHASRYWIKNCWPEEQGRTKRPKIHGEEAAAALKRSRQACRKILPNRRVEAANQPTNQPVIQSVSQSVSQLAVMEKSAEMQRIC